MDCNPPPASFTLARADIEDAQQHRAELELQLSDANANANLTNSGKSHLKHRCRSSGGDCDPHNEKGLRIKP